MALGYCAVCFSLSVDSGFHWLWESESVLLCKMRKWMEKNFSDAQILDGVYLHGGKVADPHRSTVNFWRMPMSGNGVMFLRLSLRRPRTWTKLSAVWPALLLLELEWAARAPFCLLLPSALRPQQSNLNPPLGKGCSLLTHPTWKILLPFISQQEAAFFCRHAFSGGISTTQEFLGTWLALELTCAHAHIHTNQKNHLRHFSCTVVHGLWPWVLVSCSKGSFC